MAPRTIIVGDIEQNLWHREHGNFVNMYGKFRCRLRQRRNQLTNKYKTKEKIYKAPLDQFDESREHPNYPGLANSIRFDETEDRGRRALASRNILPCKTIAAVEAYASVVERTDEPYCLTCHELQFKYIKCEYCLIPLFCDATCRDNNKAHRYECGTDFHSMKFDNDLIVKCAIQMVFESLAKFDGVPNTDRGRLQRLMRSVQTLLNGHSFEPSIPAETNREPSKFECIMRLKATAEDLERRTELAYNIIMRMPRIAKNFQGEPQQMFLNHLLMHFLMVLRENSFENAFSVRDDIQKCSIFDMISLFNHSCSPNLVKIMHGTKMYLVSTRFIGANEELTIDYKDFRTENTKERRNMLENIWGFPCNCVRCVYADNIKRKIIEITQDNITQAARTSKRNPFKSMESKLRTKFKLKRVLPWTLKIGALGIAYKDIIVKHLRES